MDNYEEKYKAALGWMQSLYGVLHGATKEEAEKYFPELKESEDERIRKKVIEVLKLNIKGAESQMQASRGVDRCFEIYACNKVIAWLEKQGEPEDKGEISDGYHTFNELYRYRMLYNAAFFNLLPKELVHKSKRHHDGKECFGGGWFIVMANLPTGQISNHYELKDWDLFQIPEKEIADEWDGHTPQEAAERLHKYLLEKQGKQTADKVEPKFKVSDWLQYRYAEPFLVEEITEQGYCNGDSCLPFEWEDEIHLWTIQDAKKGDVLASGDVIFIFNNIHGVWVRCHCSLRKDGSFKDRNYDLMYAKDSKEVYPATKEQRELLFQKMKEAGYEWDTEKRELKKIELKTLNAAEVIEWMEKHIIEWKGQDLIKTFTPNSPAGKSYIVEQFKQDFGL